MDQEIKLSILVPHYNSIGLLRKLILSVPNLKDIEIIIVDDKSDLTREVWDEFKVDFANRNLSLYFNDTEVKSASKCRNIALQHAKGEWLLFADADDYFLDSFYNNVKKYFDTDYDLIFFSPISEMLEGTGECKRHIQFEKMIENFFRMEDKKYAENQLKYLFVSPWSKLYRHSMIQENNIRFEEIMVANDVMFSTECGYTAKKIAVSEKNIYCITESQGSLTRYITKERYRCRLDVFIRHYKFLEEKLSKEEFKQLNIVGIYQIVSCIQNKFGIREVFATTIKLIKSGIPIVSKKTIKRWCNMILRK